MPASPHGSGFVASFCCVSLALDLLSGPAQVDQTPSLLLLRGASGLSNRCHSLLVRAPALRLDCPAPCASCRPLPWQCGVSQAVGADLRHLLRLRLLVYPTAPQLANFPINYFVHGVASRSARCLPACLLPAQIASLQNPLPHQRPAAYCGGGARFLAARSSGADMLSGANFFSMGMDTLINSQPFYFVYILPGFFLCAPVRLSLVPDSRCRESSSGRCIAGRSSCWLLKVSALCYPDTRSFTSCGL